VLRDEPFLFYKVTRAFDLYDVEIRQSLITTIGNQVADYFYLDPEGYERLRASSFEERLLAIVRAEFA
jgi:UTP:GlnB (protein PII) uridylyltransferase